MFVFTLKAKVLGLVVRSDTMISCGIVNMSSCALYRIPACQLSHYQITPTEAMVCDERNLPKILEHSALQQCGSAEGVELGIGAGVSIQLPLHHTIPSRHIL